VKGMLQTFNTGRYRKRCLRTQHIHIQKHGPRGTTGPIEQIGYNYASSTRVPPILPCFDLCNFVLLILCLHRQIVYDINVYPNIVCLLRLRGF